jgi:hypothetical protein
MGSGAERVSCCTDIVYKAIELGFVVEEWSI